MEEKTKKKKKRGVLRFFLWGFGSLAVLVLLVLIIAMGATSKPTNVARNFLGNLSNQELETAYNMTSAQFKASVPPPQFTQFLQQYPILTSQSDISFSHRSVENGIATISGKITADNGIVAPVTLMVVKEGDGWRVLSLSLRPEDTPRGSFD